MAEANATFIDLFCGCGGFALGMMRAGFRCLGAIDNDPTAVHILRQNMPQLAHQDSLENCNVLECDLTTFTPAHLAEHIGTSRVDVIVGGPPCQGFSTARHVDGANHGARLKRDPRRQLYTYFLRFVEFFQPRVFVMENVLGLRTAAGGKYFTKVQHEARTLGLQVGRPGYRVHAQVEDARELGVPQKRRRQLIVGVRADLPGFFMSELQPVYPMLRNIPLGAAIGDLPVLRAGGGTHERDYDLTQRNSHKRCYGTVGEQYLHAVAQIGLSAKLHNHVARPHSERDLRDFRLLKEGENSGIAIRERGVRFEFPYDKTKFKDRYTRQHRLAPCSTIVAHLSKDGLMFIHPTQNRSITPREAARVQSFPDWYAFPAERTHAFRLIGNAVPPLVAEAVGNQVKELLATMTSYEASLRSPTKGMLPVGARKARFHGCRSSTAVTTERSAAECLDVVSKYDQGQLRSLSKKRFLVAWHAFLFLFPELHPENALDHGHAVRNASSAKSVSSTRDSFFPQRYVRTGWPVALSVLGQEAWRRFHGKEISEEAFYCLEAQRAGLGISGATGTA